MMFKTTPFRRKDWNWLMVMGALLVLLLVYPFWANDYDLGVIRDALIFGILAVSLDFLWGKTDTLNFSQAAFFGMGAYGMGIVTLNVNGPWTTLLGLLAALAIPGIVALLIGYFLIFADVRGPYFIIVTMALGLICQQVAISWGSVTGGDSGLLGIPPLTIDIFGWQYEFFDGAPLYYLVLTIAAVVLIVLWLACRGHYGNILAAIKDDEIRARTLGYNTSLHLVIVLIISAMLAGLAGALYASSSGFIAPDLLGLMISAGSIVWVAVGGRGTLLGPVIGAFVVLRLEQRISSFSPDLWPLLIGIFFVAMVFLFPNGLTSLIQRRKQTG